MLNKKTLLTGAIVCLLTVLLMAFTKNSAGAHAMFTAGVVLIWLWAAAKGEGE